MRFAGILLLLSAGVAAAGDRWTALTPVDAPVGTAILAGDPFVSSTLYADTYPVAGIVKSTDGGATWVALPFQPARPESFLRNIIVERAAPNRITALSWESADSKISVYRSVDGGTHWVTHRFTPAIVGLIIDLAVDPANSNVLYAAHPRACFGSCVADSGGVSKSTDGGAHWTALFKGVEIEQVVVDPFGSGTVYAVGLQAARRSDDGGQTWTEMSPGGEGIFRLALDPVVPGVLYASSYYGFWRSDDRGDTWRKLSSFSLPAWTIAVDPTQRRTIVLGGGNGAGVKRSTDGGQTWQPLNEGLTGHPAAPSQLMWIRPFFAPNGQLYGSADFFGAMTLTPGSERRRVIRH